MNSMNDLSFLNKQVQCKIRGIQQYKKRLAVSGESLYHPFKRNVKPKVCLKSSHQANVPESTRVLESRQPAKASHQRSLVNSENSFSRDIPQDMNNISIYIFVCNSLLHSVLKGDLAHTAFITDSPEKYLLLLKAHNSVSIFGDCGRVMVLKDYNASLDKLNNEKYILIQRQGSSFLNEECHWLYWCSCDNISSRQMSSLDSNVNMSVDEFQMIYPDCIHIKAARIVYRKYDIEKDIEPFDESVEEPDGRQKRKDNNQQLI